MSMAVRRAFVLASLVSLAAASHVGAVARRAFVTSTTYTGDLASLAGEGSVLDKADAECQARAVEAGLPNAGSFRAWLSTSTTDAYCHVQGLTGDKTLNCGQGGTPTGGGPWYRRDGATPFTGRIDEMTGDEPILYLPVLLDEDGVERLGFTDGQVWTGTAGSGEARPDTCDDWESASADLRGAYGLADATARSWTDESVRPCDQLKRLLCLEEGASEPFVPKWTANAQVVFVTTVTGNGQLSAWADANGQSGLAAGDEICRARARAAHLPEPESFVAWLSDGSTDAVGRLSGDGPFARIDGFVVGADAADFADGRLDAPIAIDENGDYLATYAASWTGTGVEGLRDSAHCSGWTLPSGSSGASGEGGFVSDLWTLRNRFTCSLSRRLYCFASSPTLFWDGFEYVHGLDRWSTHVP